MVESHKKGFFPYQVEGKTGLMRRAHSICYGFKRQAQAGLFAENIRTLDF